MPSTILDVVALCGYSKATVTRAFSEPHLVKESTRNRVYEAAKELNYSPNAIAQAMARRRTDNIGFLLCEKQYPVILNPFYAPIVDAALESCSKANLSLFISSTADLRLPNGDLYFKRQLDGAILAGEVSEDIIEYFNRQQIPIVLLNNKSDDQVSVISDNYYGAGEGLRYLLKKGHRKIAMVQGVFSPYIMEQSKRAYMDVMKAHGIKESETFMSEIKAEYNTAIEYVNRLISKTDKKDWPSAFFCTNDTIAVGVVKALIRLGFKVPDDFAVLGYDDSVLATAIEPALTTVQVPKKLMGEKAVECLQELINNKDGIKTVNMFRPQLIIRGSA